MILKQVEDHVRSLFIDYNQAGLIYHNIEHTESVVKRSYEIMQHVSVTDHEKLIVIIASWFHDTGQLFSPAKGHEEESVKLMHGFFEGKNIIDTHFTDEIVSCILATRMPVNPGNLKEEIICDADTYHLGTPYFEVSDLKVKQETEARENVATNNWDHSTLKFLKQHRFYTSYCNALLNEGKENNIHKLEARLGLRE